MADLPAATTIRDRLVARGIAVPSRAEAVVIDLANDPPLGNSARAIAEEEADRIVAAVGAALLVSRAERGVIAVRERSASAAITRAIKLLDAGATVKVDLVSPLWPSTGIDRDVAELRSPPEDGPFPWAWILDGEQALDVESAAFDRERAPRRITVAGAVKTPTVLRGAWTVSDAVEAAGGAIDLGWVALDGGALGGRIADPEAPIRSSLLLVLAAAHPLVARARTSLTDWLRRAASACEGCRMCSDVCPTALDGGGLAPHDVILTLVTGRDHSAGLAAAIACTGCGVCDSACPSTLSPFALVDAVKARLPSTLRPPRRAAAHPDRAGRRMDVGLLLRRLGL